MPGWLRAVGMLVLLGVLVLLGAWVADTWILPRHVGSGSEAPMPALQGLSQQEVYRLCQERRLVVAELPAEYDASLPSGYLLRQVPRPGTSVKPGRRVSVVFSAGPRRVAVPDLRGSTERQARLCLEDLGLVPGDLLRCAGAGEAGTVLSSRPGGGVRVPVGGRVDLLLSEGPPGGAWLVPDLRGGGLASARELLAGRGLPAPRVRYQSAADRQADTVLDQSPPPGSRLERGRSLELVVASGS